MRFIGCAVSLSVNRSFLTIRPDRVNDSRSAEPEKLYRDSITGAAYRQVSSRSTYPRDERDYVDPPPRSRTAMDTMMRDRDEPRTQLSEYWFPGEGIEQEVLQSEITKFLGQDATCHLGQDSQVCRATGYWW